MVSNINEDALEQAIETALTGDCRESRGAAAQPPASYGQVLLSKELRGQGYIVPDRKPFS